MNSLKNKKALVIGGGLGGLACALSLRAKGYEVSVFEKNKHWGGKLNVSENSGFKFDLGPSILTMPHIFRDVFAQFQKNMNDYFTIHNF